MEKNYVYIAQSIDGYIAEKDGAIDWLIQFDDHDKNDYGYKEFIQGIDAIVMGKNTYLTVAEFPEWPYSKPVYVLSTSLKTIDDARRDVHLLSLHPPAIVETLRAKGCHNLYIDGGKTIQRFLSHDLIDEMIITTLPLLLGDGIPLFAPNNKKIPFNLAGSTKYKNGMVKNHYTRK